MLMLCTNGWSGGYKPHVENGQGSSFDFTPERDTHPTFGVAMAVLIVV